ncbi:dTDP-glucose 4,6-dehydratase [Sphingomonas alpina]|uniref:dTDP-glucose 4,6-dehydratase n=1 Tax=Sphingomonas alpina TaxID=653931 RepID=A0A7H0LDE1_9SPHN|nr:dTDP-glucose 4,6-dehydratase [Sphingomonas alpina]QNQ07694.1 dTDP-glucose 4,6-dehydratase [Sphingomonas alpina]
MKVVSNAPERTVLVTGGAGFIGSAVCRHLVAGGRTRVINLDKMTYAASHTALAEVEGSPNYRFVQGDIADRRLVAEILRGERVDAVMHLAAESHVDRSIDGPAVFIETNITGTFHMLEAALDHWRSLDDQGKGAFRFHHVSTDEVFGDLPFDDSLFSEESAYRPSSPYSASKAAADHLVRAWHHTYGLPVVLSNCSNNYGPHQYPEKLIPLTITRAAMGLTLPVYGTGANVRDWLHVADHARALELVMTRGEAGATYVVGGREEHNNVAVVAMICDLIDERMPLATGRRRNLIRFVEDRAGHDRRYAIDPSRIELSLDWRPEIGFREGLAATVDWYLANQAIDSKSASAS